MQFVTSVVCLQLIYILSYFKLLRKLAQSGFEANYGARALRRAVHSQIENPLARSLLEGEFGPKGVVNLEAINGIITFAKE